MAFSFRAGTNWCHDFPKLARESGFYFNMHTARVRVDWNRISSIDIDRVVRERDFQTVDENVNNVIDYYLESEYDVKILDPNFVKLFRLAQLAVEYLLYCKQYLDQSVVILKEELKYKIEENIKQKEEITRLQDSLKEIKEKSKETYKCPHCPKTFFTASFVNAHVVRRHSNFSDALLNSPSANDEYRAETEKLHNEIKTLKERLNQTERVIRNESKAIVHNEIAKRERTLSSLEDGTDSIQDDQYKRYQEEISNLKSMLFTEIRNIKRKENNTMQQDNETIHENIKELVSQQENEIKRLRNQLQDHLSSNTNEVQTKLVKQEEYWKSKIEQIENQHRNDIENLFTQLKLTQESASRTKSEYEEKVAFLEKQSMDQSKLLSTQSEQLSQILAKGIIANKHKKDSETQISDKKLKIESFTEDTMDSESSPIIKKPTKKKFLQDLKLSPNIMKTNQSYERLVNSTKKIEEQQKPKSREEIARESNLSKYKDNKKSEKPINHKKTTKAGKQYTSLNESDKSETSTASETESETDEDSDEETSESSVTRTESTNDEAPSDVEYKPVKQDSHHQRRSSTVSLETIKQEILETFENKLKNLGIDPEWNGIPIMTYRQQMKFPKYEQIRKKILEEVTKKIFINKKSPKILETEKKSFLNKAMKNVKSKAIKALHDFKIPKDNDSSTPAVSSRNSTPRESQAKRRFSLELLPKKPTQMDIQEIKKQTRQEPIRKLKKEEPQTTRPKSSLQIEENVRQQVVKTIVESPKRAKLQRSYQSIEEFMRDIEGSPKTEMKVTSTPSRNLKNILQDTFMNDSDDQIKKPDALAWALASPKNSKSVLKSTNNAMSGLVKKKVLFDLERETSSEKASTAKSIGELPMEDIDEKKEGNDSDWNISSISEEKEKIVIEQKSASNENIQLKTSQSTRIAEIAKKVQDKLEASRRKPPNSIEAMFAARSFSNDDEEINESHEIKDSKDIVHPALENSSSHIEPRPRTANQVPRPAPRKQLFGTKDSSLDMDYDELLAIRQN